MQQLIFSSYGTENIRTELIFNPVLGHKRLIFQGRSIYLQKINKTAEPECPVYFIDVSLGNIEIFYEQFSYRLRHCRGDIEPDNFAVTT